jgi:ParB family transcriptional regulator, chromosome partitioning protein
MGAGKDARTIVSISPFRCRMCAMHDRFPEYITEDSCKEEIRSFARYGQLVPVLGRPLINDPRHDVELIYGARRLFVASHLNVPLVVEVREITDREAVVAMDIENRGRHDISAYERGRAYLTWIKEGLFASQDDLANSLGVSASQVSRLLKIARLPAVIVGAFSSPADICEGWGLDLAGALEDSQRREQTILIARSLIRLGSILPPKEICRRLLSPGSVSRARTRPHDEVVHGTNGFPLFRIRYSRKVFALLLPTERLSSSALGEVRDAVRSLLQREIAEPIEYNGNSAGDRAGNQGT